MEETLILGKRSFFSKELKKIIKNSQVLNITDLRRSKKNNYILIINYSYPSKFLKNNKNLNLFNKIYLNEFEKIFSHIISYPPKKIIFSSTSSIYSYSKYIKNFKIEYYPKIINSIFKKIIEKKLLKIGKKLNIKILLCRLFNLYGDNDGFSFISIIKNKKKIVVNNDGFSKRDYIHVSDASKIYNFLIKSNLSGIIDIGTGKDISLRNIEKKLNLKKNFYFSKNKDVIEKSKANIDKIKIFFKSNYLINDIDYLNNKNK